jgi:DNA-binding protein HU-beta
MPKSKKEFIALLAKRMDTDETITARWVESYTETLIDIFKTGEGVTIDGLGGFYLARKYGNVIFKFNPSQRLRKLFGWSSTHKGDV